MPIDVAVYRARWLIPVSRPPLRDGFLVVQSGRIVDVGSGRCSLATTMDLGDVAIIPGLINAHTHFEFSGLERPLGQRGISLANWLPLVVAYRRNAIAADGGELSNASVGREPSISRGVSESRRCGVVAAGEIASAPWSCAYPRYPRTTVFAEQLGLKKAQTTDRLNEIADHLSQQRSQGAMETSGISPHAPYSVNRELFAGLVRLAVRWRLPLAVHLAESREELQLLESGTGPLMDFLSAMGVWEGPSSMLSIDEAIAQFPTGSKSLLIHGNYLTTPQLDAIAQRRGELSLVYCPRTHSYFGHEPYRLAEAIQREICVALGTDSRASNPDLCLWSELVEAHQRHPWLSPAEVLRMGTFSGAEALGIAGEYGSLDPGKSARFCTIPIEAMGDADPIAALLASGQRPTPFFAN